MSIYSQKTDPVIEDGKIKRNAPGKGAKDYELIIDADSLSGKCKYPIRVEEQRLTEAESRDLIDSAKKEIDSSFYRSGEGPDHVSVGVNMKSSYMEGRVTANWYLSDYELINTEGEISDEDLEKEGTIVTVEAELTCNEVKEIYSFPFHVYPRALSEEEQLVKDINVVITTENEKVGSEYLALPEEINGVKLTWNQVKEHLTVKILLLEILGIILLWLSSKKQKQEEIKKRQDSMRIDYAEIVSKMAILLGSGMSVKESWNRISACKTNKEQKITKTVRPIYEEMQYTIREIEDGVSERIAYQNFGERVALSEYYRFVRLLVSNMQKGNRSICLALEEEAISAYEQRRMLMKKKGEEAGTKMLIPLMIMLIIVMAIIMIPAMLGF